MLGMRTIRQTFAALVVGYAVTPNHVSAIDVGDLIVSDPSSFTLFAVNSKSGAFEPYSEGSLVGAGEYGSGVVVRRDGSVFGTNGAIVFRVDPVSRGQEILASEGFTSAYAITTDANDDLIVGDVLGAAVVRVDPTTGAVTPIASGGDIGYPIGITLGLDGQLYVVDPLDGQVLRIDPVSGDQGVVSSGGSLGTPTAITTLPDGGLLTVNADAGALVRVDPITGAQQVLASSEELIGVTGVALSPLGQAFLTRYGFVLRADLSTGDVTVHASDFGTANSYGTSIAAVPGCGNGRIDEGETCDDGNRISGDCCDAACGAEPNGSSCDDGDSETADRCQAGACIGTRVGTVESRGQRVLCQLDDISGTGDARCRVTGTLVDEAVVGGRDRGAPVEVLKPVDRLFKRRRSRVTLRLRLNAFGRQLLQRQGRVRVQVHVDLIDRQERSSTSSFLLNFLRRRR